jgi:hypothetical protein
MLKKHPSMQLLEVKSVNDDGEATYTFIDQSGQVYISTENSSDDLSQDIGYTLKQHGFILPERYTPHKATEEIPLSASRFTIHGDIQTASVLVADYIDSSDKIYLTFLLYKSGGYKELTKKREGKVLLERAEEMLYRTRLPDGYYLIDGHKQSKIWQSDIYKLISQMETAMYNISMQFAPPVNTEPSGKEDETGSESPSEHEQGEEGRSRRSKKQTRLHVVSSHESPSEPTETDAGGDQPDPTESLGEQSTSEAPTE